MKKLLIIAVVALTGLSTFANERAERREDRRDERRERIEDRRDERAERREDRRRPGWGGIFRPRPIYRQVTRSCISVFRGRTYRQKRFRAVATGRRGTGVKQRACRKALRKCRANYPRRARLCVVR